MSIVERVRAYLVHIVATDGGDDWIHHSHAMEYASLSTFAAEEAELRRDAERYRWLRSNPTLLDEPLDAEIDAAIRENKKT